MAQCILYMCIMLATPPPPSCHIIKVRTCVFANITAKSGLISTVLIMLTTVSALGISWKTRGVVYHALYTMNGTHLSLCIVYCVFIPVLP